MSRLLVKNIDTLVSCDNDDHVYNHVDLVCEDGRICAIRPHEDSPAVRSSSCCTSGDSSGHMPKGDAAEAEYDTVIDGTGMLCYPGLVNAHHHLYQIFSRNLPQVQNMELFDWLTTLYEVWKNLNEDTIRLSSLVGIGELMKNGCTTIFDHHYVFPENGGDLLAAQWQAAEMLGARMHFSRGSMDLSKKDGGLPPDSVVQSVDEIMKDSVRLVEKYQDNSFTSMHRIALAPCSPFSVSSDLLRESAKLARSCHVRLHTHLCETKDEERFTLEHFGLRPVAYMESLGWLGPDVWFAHGIHLNDEEIQLLADTGTGVCHCPISNMKLSSGIARIPDMLKAGVHVGLGVDGSASNDGSNLLEEMRVCFLLHRLNSSKAAPDGYQVLKMATIGSAALLGREHEIGSLETGKCADFFLIDSHRLELVGACYDPKSVLATVGLKGAVDWTVVNGKVTVEHGRLTGADEEKIVADADEELKRYLADIM